MLQNPLNQLLLPLEVEGRYAEELVYGSCNADAFAWLERFPDWPIPFIYVEGPEKSGKSTLSKMYRKRINAFLVNPGTPLLEIPENRAIIVDDAENMDEEILFHLYNRAKITGYPLILFSVMSPSEMPALTRDVRSRLMSFYVIPLLEPDDQTFRLLLRKQLQDLGVSFSENIIELFLQKAERSYKTIHDFAEFLGKRSLTLQKNMTRHDVMEFFENVP